MTLQEYLRRGTRPLHAVPEPLTMAKLDQMFAFIWENEGVPGTILAEPRAPGPATPRRRLHVVPRTEEGEP